LLQVKEQLALNGMRAFKGGAPLPAALVLAPPQAQQVGVVDAGFFIFWVHLFYVPLYKVNVPDRELEKATRASISHP